MLNDERCKMISSSREKGFGAKEEEGVSNEGKVISKGSLPLPLASSSRQWSGLRNPRIVRVSRSFGGKDRHSKVCTIRGLRDRRIRLSVPTAIQLYDLQDRLGLSQPSKVIDWLLDNTKNDIDKLPPLQMPQGFGQFQHQMMLPSQSSQLAPFFDVNSMFMKDGNDVDVDHLRAKSKQIERESPSAAADHKGKWVEVMNENEETQAGNGIGDYGGQEKLFSIAANHSAGLMMNNAMPPFSSYYHWEPSTLSLSQFGNHNHGYLSSQTTDNFLNVNNTSVAAAAASPSSLALPSAAHATQLFFCPPSTMPSLFPSYPPYGNAAMAGSVPAQGDISDSKQINYFQLLNSNSQHVLPNSVAAMKPFSLNVNAGVASHTHQNDDESHADDEDNTES